jgi:hypothetical protein
MDNFNSGNLAIEVSKPQPTLMRLDWRGKSNDRQPGKMLTPFFATATAEAVSAKASMEMHFEKLEYFNSSTITSIIQLIQSLRQQKVPLTIFFAGNVKWQKLGFDALRIFEKGDGLLTFKAIP